MIKATVEKRKRTERSEPEQRLRKQGVTKRKQNKKVKSKKPQVYMRSPKNQHLFPSGPSFL
jgi:hypothetical protein